MATPTIYGPLVFAAPALSTQPGLIQLSGAFGGAYDAPRVVAIGTNNVLLPTSAGTTGQVLQLTSPTELAWTTPSAGGGSTAKRVTTDTWASSVTPNGATTDIYRLTLSGGPTTVNTPSGTPVDGQQLQVHFIQDGTGTRTVTFGPGYAFSTDVPLPTLSTAAGATDILGFQYSGPKAKWLLLGVVKGF